MLIIFIAALFGTANTYAQQDDFGWRIGYGIGFMNYYGDLSYKVKNTSKDHYLKTKDRGGLSQGIFLERRLSPGTSFQVNYNSGKFSGSDRAYKGSDYYLRALNFETSVKDLSAAFVFRSDNGFLLGRNSVLAPYVLVGAGVTRFKVFGDLEDENGVNYDYSDSNEEVELDGDYETELTNLGTELEDDYNTTVLNIPVGVGLKFGLGPRVSLHLQTDLKYTFTDHLDDVSDAEYRVAYDSDLQEYAARPNPSYSASERGNDNGLNDIYMFTSVSLRFSFGRKNEKFKTPFIYTSDSPLIYNADSSKQMDSNNSEDAINENEATTNTSNADATDENGVESIAKENASSKDGEAEIQAPQTETENAIVAEPVNQADNKSTNSSLSNGEAADDTNEGSNAEGGIDSDSKIDITINNNIYKDGVEVQETKEVIKIEEEIEEKSEKKKEANEKEKIEETESKQVEEDQKKEEERSNEEVEVLKKEMEELQRKLELKELLEEEKEKQELKEDIEDIKEEMEELNEKSTSNKETEEAAQKAQKKEAERQVKELEKELDTMQKQMDELNEELKKKETESRPLNNEDTSNNTSKTKEKEQGVVEEEMTVQKEAKFELKEPIDAGGSKSGSKLKLTEQDRRQINFGLNTSSLIQASELDKLKELAVFMQENPDYWLHIKAYTDKNTSDQQLAEKRANYIKDYLMRNYSINPQKLILSSFEQNEFFMLDAEGNELDQKAIVILLK